MAISGDRSNSRTIPARFSRRAQNKLKRILGRFLARTYPRSLRWPYVGGRPVQPEGASWASSSGAGSRWPRTGATRTPNARRLELHRSRRHSWRHRTPWRQCRNSAPSGQALSGSKAVGRKHSATGGHAEESFKHRARDAGEKADLRISNHLSGGPGRDCRSLRCGDMPKPGSPLDPRRPARPRTVSESASAAKLGRIRAARTRTAV